MESQRVKNYKPIFFGLDKRDLMISTACLVVLYSITIGIFALFQALVDANKFVKDKTFLPVIVCGGAGNWNNFIDAFQKSNVDGACTNNIYHYSEKSIKLIKETLKKKGIYVRSD